MGYTFGRPHEIPRGLVPDDGFYHEDKSWVEAMTLNDVQKESSHYESPEMTTSRSATASWSTVTSSATTARITSESSRTSIDNSQWAQQTPKESSILSTMTTSKITPTIFAETGSLSTHATQQTASLDKGKIAELAHPAANSHQSFAYAIVSVIFVTGVIAASILFWLRKKNQHLKAKLAKHNHPPSGRSDGYRSPLEQLEKSASRIKDNSIRSLKKVFGIVKRYNTSDAHLRSLESYTNEALSAAGKNKHNSAEYMPSKFEIIFDRTKQIFPRIKQIFPRIKEIFPRIKEIFPRIKEIFPRIKQIFPRIKQIFPRIKSRSISPFSIIRGLLKSRNDAKTNAVPVESSYAIAYSPHPPNDNSRKATILNDTAEKEKTNVHHCMCKEPPHKETAATTVESISLRKVSSGKGEKGDCPTSTTPSSCTISRLSSFSATAETEQRGGIMMQSGAATASVELFQKKAYRVEMDFEPRNSSHMRLHNGQFVVISQLFDDGWAFCEPIVGENGGLVPRACLSSWPITQGLEDSTTSPTGLEVHRKFSNIRTASITPVSVRLPRFYGSDTASEFSSREI